MLLHFDDMWRGDCGMGQYRSLKLKTLELGDGIPKICVPITAADAASAVAQAEAIAASCDADMAEWRVDRFDMGFSLTGSADIEKIRVAARRICDALKGKPLIFTFRNYEEGGERFLPEQDYRRLVMTAIEDGTADLVDVEFKKKNVLEEAVRLAQCKGKKHCGKAVSIIASYHDFDKTPDFAELIKLFKEMQIIGASITKIAVMPSGESDVKKLTDAAHEMKEHIADRPYVAISMGEQGRRTRLEAADLGSALSFAVITPGSTESEKYVSMNVSGDDLSGRLPGKNAGHSAGAASAPGQIPLEELKKYFEA